MRKVRDPTEAYDEVACYFPLFLKMILPYIPLVFNRLYFSTDRKNKKGLPLFVYRMAGIRVSEFWDRLDKAGIYDQ